MEERVANTCKAERIIIKRKNGRRTCMKERGSAIRNDKWEKGKSKKLQGEEKLRKKGRDKEIEGESVWDE